MSRTAPFATIVSSDEILVQIPELDPPLNANEAGDILGMGADEILDALDREDNRPYRRLLYQGVHDALGGSIYDAVSGADVPLPHDGELEDDQIHEWLAYLVARTQPGDWALPIGGFFVPRYPALTRRLGRAEEKEQYAGRLTYLDMVAYEGAEDVIAELRRRCDVLQKAIKTSRGGIRKHAPHIAALDRAYKLADLQSRHWHNEDLRRKAGRDHDGDETTLPLRVAVMERLKTRLDYYANAARQEMFSNASAAETSAALGLLALFDPAHPDSAALGELLTTFSEHPYVLSAPEAMHLRESLCLAFSLLASSWEVDRFLLNHFLPVFEEFSGRAQQRIEDELTKLEDATRFLGVRDTWRDAVEAARAGMSDVPVSDTTLRVVAKSAEVFKSFAGIIAAGLSDKLIARFLHYVNLANKDIAKFGDGGFSVATALMRYLGVACVSGTLLGPSQWKYHTLLDTIARAGEPDHHGAIARKQLARLRVGDGFMRTQRAIGVALAADVVTILFAANNLKDGDPGTILKTAFSLMTSTAGAALKLVEHSLVKQLSVNEMLRINEFGKRTWDGPKRVINPVEPELARVQFVSKHLSGIVAGVSAIVMCADLAERWEKGARIPDLWLEGISTAGQIASAASWLTGLHASLGTAAAWLGMAGAVLGAAALTTAIIIELTDDGPEKLFQGYVDFALQSHIVDSIPAERKALERAIEDANKGAAFAEFRRFVGARFTGESNDKGEYLNDPSVGAPTWHGAAQLGFTPREISVMFGDGAARLSMASFYGEDPERPEKEGRAAPATPGTGRAR